MTDAHIPQLEDRERAYCISVSIQHAVMTMRIDWNWKQIARVGALPVFEDPEGRAVFPISDCNRLRGYPPETKFYPGYCFFSAIDFFNWEAQHLARGGKFEDAPTRKETNDDHDDT